MPCYLLGLLLKYSVFKSSECLFYYRFLDTEPPNSQTGGSNHDKLIALNRLISDFTMTHDPTL
jgi:hypothetical protein